MADLPLFTQCITDDVATYDTSISGGNVITVTCRQLFDTLTGDALIFACKLSGNNKGLAVYLKQDKLSVDIITSDGVSSNTYNQALDCSLDRLYNFSVLWDIQAGADLFIDNGYSGFQTVDSSNLLVWAGASSQNLEIGCNSETKTVESAITIDGVSDTSYWLSNEGTTIFGNSGNYTITLSTGNWNIGFPQFEFDYIQNSRNYDIWQNDTTGAYYLAYFVNATTPYKTDGDTFTGYTWVKQITEPQNINFWNNWEVLDPNDNITRLDNDALSSTNYVFRTLVDGQITGLAIYESGTDFSTACQQNTLLNYNCGVLDFSDSRNSGLITLIATRSC